MLLLTLYWQLSPALELIEVSTELKLLKFTIAYFFPEMSAEHLIIVQGAVLHWELPSRFLVTSKSGSVVGVILCDQVLLGIPREEVLIYLLAPICHYVGFCCSRMIQQQTAMTTQQNTWAGPHPSPLLSPKFILLVVQFLCWAEQCMPFCHAALAGSAR